MSRRKSRLPAEPVEVTVDSLSHDGRGVARVEEKAVFISGALPGELVRFRYQRRHRRYDEGHVVEVIEPSLQRVEPLCEYFDRCGGCSLQHLGSEYQIEHKQRLLMESLRRLGNVEPEQILAPLTGPHWGYRRKARLGARYVKAKGRVLVGFRERMSSFIAECERCVVLDERVGSLLGAMASLIDGLSIKREVPQIEVAIGDSKGTLVFRHLSPITADDQRALIQFGQSHDLQIQLQPAGEDSVTPLWPEQQTLEYTLPDQELEFKFLATDFVQVNTDINRAMIGQAIELLEPDSDDNMLDLFCGLGNFTLPLARRVNSITGVEGGAGLVERARENAYRNKISNAKFHVADLAADFSSAATEPFWLKEAAYTKVLLDPPRTGALEVLPALQRIAAPKILYVSCNPATLARDADLLVNGYGYALTAAGVMDMFPNTSHGEAMALFEL